MLIQTNIVIVIKLFFIISGLYLQINADIDDENNFTDNDFPDLVDGIHDETVYEEITAINGIIKLLTRAAAQLNTTTDKNEVPASSFFSKASNDFTSRQLDKIDTKHININMNGDTASKFNPDDHSFGRIYATGDTSGDNIIHDKPEALHKNVRKIFQEIFATPKQSNLKETRSDKSQLTINFYNIISSGTEDIPDKIISQLREQTQKPKQKSSLLDSLFLSDLIPRGYSDSNTQIPDKMKSVRVNPAKNTQNSPIHIKNVLSPNQESISTLDTIKLPSKNPNFQRTNLILNNESLKTLDSRRIHFNKSDNYNQQNYKTLNNGKSDLLHSAEYTPNLSDLGQKNSKYLPVSYHKNIQNCKIALLDFSKFLSEKVYDLLLKLACLEMTDNEIQLLLNKHIMD